MSAWLLKSSGRPEEWAGRSLQSQLSQQAKAVLSPWTDCDRKERYVVREMKGEGT